jgi:hypothetical protein
MDETYVNEIIEKLRLLASEAFKQDRHQRYLDLLDAAEALAKWRDAGMEGELPVDLRRFGIAVPAEVFAPSEEEECREWLQEGIDAIEAGDLRKAIDLFQRVIEGCSGEVKDLAEKRISDAKAELSKQIEEWRKKARKARQVGDLEVAERAWREFLRLCPEDREARGALEEITREKALEEQKPIYEEDTRKARHLLSKFDRQLSDIEEGLRMVERLRSVEIVDKELEELYKRGCEERAEILRRAGQVATLKYISTEIEPRLAQLEKRRKTLEEMIADGIKKFPDAVTGEMLKTEEELGRTIELYKETWERYKVFCRNKALEYLDRAEEDLKKGFPKAAEDKLKTALERFRALPDEEKILLEDKLTEVEDLIEVEALIDQTVDLRRKLELLRQVEGRHPYYPGLDVRIERAKSELATTISKEIQIKCNEARAALNRRSFEKARSICGEAQRLVVKDVEETEIITRTLTDLDALLKQIEEEEIHWQELGDLAQQINEALDRKDYSTAEKLLEGIPDEDKRDPRIQALSVKLVEYKDDAWTYNQALSAYEDGNYPLAIQLCDEIAKKKGELPPKFKELRRKAKAGEAFISAIDMLGEDLDEARRGFQTAKRLDGGWKAECDCYLEKIEYVQKELKRAEGYERMGRWQEAYDTLIAIKEASPDFMPLIAGRMSVVRSNWYEQLKEDVQRSLSRGEPDYETAFKLISTMRDYGLLLEDEDRELANEVELNYYKSNALFYEGLEDWGEAAKWWDRVVQLRLRRRDLEAITQLRQARKKECLGEVLKARVDRDYGKAISLLKNALREDLKVDPDLLFELAKICLEDGRLDEAAQHAQSVKIVQEDYPGLDELQAKIEEEQEVDAALKKSQSLFEEGEYEKAVEVIEDIEGAYPDRKELKRKREELTKQAVELLLKKAERERPFATGPKLAEVIRTYDRVLRLDRSNQEAREGIKACKVEIPKLIDETIQEARRFDVVGKEPQEAISEATSLISRIEDCRAISKYSSKSKSYEYEEKLKGVLEQVTGKRANLQAMINLMEDARQKLREAVKSGEFGPAERAIREAEDRANDLANDLYSYKPEELKRLSKEIKETKEKRQKVQSFLEKLQEEWRYDEDPKSFDSIIKICADLENLDPHDRFGLQDEVRTYYDEFLKREISGLRELKRLAEDRRYNYGLWEEWHKRVDNLHKEAGDLLKEARKKREQASLREAIDAYDACLAKCEEAEVHFAQKPREKPISWLAEDLKKSAGEMASDVHDYKQRAQEEKAECEKGREEVERLKRLITEFLNRPLSKFNLDSAERFLRDALKIDSKDEKLQKLKRQWREKRKQLEERKARRWPFRR